MHFYCIQNHIFIDYFTVLHMKHLNSKKTCFLRFDKILVIQPIAEVYGEGNERQLCEEIDASVIGQRSVEPQSNIGESLGRHGKASYSFSPYEYLGL